MPRFADLDDEQRRIYQGAPPDGSILVIGPPGTGKTVMAFHRATYLKKAGQAPRVIMYNSVLSRYVSSNNTHSKAIEVSTMHSWVNQWFREMRAGSAPTLERYVFDWKAIAEKATELISNGSADDANWGHLIVDEGQDFPAEMYRYLAVLLMGYPKGNADAPALTVFADENQRLGQKNSTIAQIRQALALTGAQRVYSLTKNYRNTRQVAEFAAHYYCGLSSGVAEPPDRKGPKPEVSLHRNQPAMIEAIIEFLEQIRGLGLEVGIICPRNRTRNYIYNKLCEEYDGYDDINIQTFKGGDDDLTADKLTFDTGGHVTVLCRESVKGLEFDAVLVIDPFLRADAQAGGEQQFKMNMYVSCSRAREHLRLLFVTDRDRVMAILPPPKKGLYELVED